MLTFTPPAHSFPGAVSFIFDFWKWFFTADGDCGTVTGGFGSFPTFGIQAYDWCVVGGGETSNQTG